MTHIIELPYTENPLNIFNALRHLPWPVFLDSGQPQSLLGRYDILTAAPYIRLTTRDAITIIETDSETQTSHDDPFLLIQEMLGPPMSNDTDLPFIGGALGFFSYDLGRRIETLPALTKQDIACPEMAMGIYDWAIVIDHLKQQTFMIAQHKDKQTKNLMATLQKTLNKVSNAQNSFQLTSRFQSNMSPQTYAQAYQTIKDYIFAGDCYEVNLAQRFQATFTGDPWQAYQAIRKINPTPFAAFCEYPFAQLLSHSPERFLQIKRGHVESKPIKGTRPRCDTPEKDLQLATELASSPKDRAENVMIVDLMRNDLGRVCETGSITVPNLFSVESFPAVHHLVSTVTGKLAKDKTSIDCLRACFPGGSITGAPKIRAMQIIEESEPVRRAVYCGSIGYISFDGNADTNIAIRTLLCENQNIYCYAGGAIVADSECDAEYQECLDKVTIMLHTLENL